MPESVAEKPILDPIEKAIRTALEKGDADDPEFRGRIYRSVEAALDRVIQSNPQLTVEKAIGRRKQLQQKIAEIESEFSPALPAEDMAAIDARLDEALLDILEHAPGEARSGGRHAVPQSPVPGQPGFAASPVEPIRPASQTPPSAAVPSVMSPAERHEAVGEAPAIRPDTVQEAAQGAAAPPPVEPAAHREPVFSTFDPTPEPSPGRVEPVLGDGRFSAAARRAEAAEPVPSQAVKGPDRMTRSAQADAPAPSHQSFGPTVDLDILPGSAGRFDADFDFPVIPPALDTADISAPIPESPPEIVAADRVARSRERRRPFAAAFLGIALLSLAAVGVIFAFQTGLLKSPEERDTSVPNPPPELGSEDFDPSAEGPPTLSDQPAAEQNWITVFSPDDPATATTPGDTTAEAMQDDSGSFLRIRSGASGAAVSFDVGQGVLEQLAGRTAVFNVSARGEEGQQTEMSIECNFGELGDCGRKRYEVGYEKGEFLFEITFPDKQPGASGTIAINSDFSGQGKAIDIYEIRAAAQ
jgi:hypothetical protein